MNDAPEKIHASAFLNGGIKPRPHFHAGTNIETPCFDQTEYLRYDKHTAYMADMTAAYAGSCKQIDKYREQRETDKVRIEELEAARDFGIIEGDAVAHLKVVALQTRVEELTAALDALRGRYRLYSGWPEMSWAGDTDVALLKMADQALGDTTRHKDIFF
jgi:hypothetical protein